MGGDRSVKFRGFSLAPRAGFGIMTKGKFVNFNDEFPNGATRLVGGEATFDFEGLKAGKPMGRIGQLAFVYLWGYLKEKFSQDDLPIGALGDIFPFSSTRVAHSHYMFAEYRWDADQALYSSKHVSVLHPRFSVGMGGYYIKTTLTEGDADPRVIRTGGFIATGATQVRLIGLRYGRFEFALELSIRIFAGQTFGFAGTGGIRFGYVAPKTKGP